MNNEFKNLNEEHKKNEDDYMELFKKAGQLFDRMRDFERRGKIPKISPTDIERLLPSRQRPPVQSTDGWIGEIPMEVIEEKNDNVVGDASPKEKPPCFKSRMNIIKDIQEVVATGQLIDEDGEAIWANDGNDRLGLTVEHPEFRVAIDINDLTLYKGLKTKEEWQQLGFRRFNQDGGFVGIPTIWVHFIKDNVGDYRKTVSRSIAMIIKPASERLTIREREYIKIKRAAGLEVKVLKLIKPDSSRYPYVERNGKRYAHPEIVKEFRRSYIDEFHELCFDAWGPEGYPVLFDEATRDVDEKNPYNDSSQLN